MRDQKPHGLNRRTFLSTAGALGGGALAMPIIVSATFPAQAQDCTASVSAHAIAKVAMPTPAPATDAVAKLSEAGLWYTDTGGDGVPVIFLHPATAAGTVWGYQQPVFAAAGYRFIAYSRRSYFGSEAGPAETKATDADDLLELLDSLGIEKFHGVGVAAGGIRLVDFALSNPKRLASMVLACTTGGVTDPEYEKISERLLPEGFAAMPAAFRELSASYRVSNPDGTKAWEAEVERAIPEKRIRLRNKNSITWEGIAGFAMPTLLITGDADLYMPPAVLELFAEHLPHSEKHVIDGAAHSVYWEQPDIFNKLVIDFIKRA